MAVAVIDMGKTHARVALVGADGAQESWGAETPVRRDGPYPAEDVDALWPFVLDALARAGRLAQVRAVVPVGHGAAGGLVGGLDGPGEQGGGGAGGLVLPVMDYEHDGPAEVAADYAAARPDFAESGSPALPDGQNLGRQLFWQARRFPDAFARAQAFLTLPQYWAWRLCGVAASEATSLGAHSDLWAPAAGRLSSLVAAQGWTRLFPPLRRAWEALGPILPAVAAATGLPPDTPVLAGLHDSNAALLSHLGAGGPAAVVSTGTWVIVMHVGGSMARLDPEADMLANVDALGRPTPSARFMGGREYAALAAGDAPPTWEAARAVMAAGTLAAPAFSTAGGPWRGRPGRILGEVPDMPGARAALASLYAALVTDDLLDRLGVRGAVAADGPFAANPVWLGALAALRAPDPVGVARAGGPAGGAALLADWRADRDAAPMAAAAPADVGALAACRARWRAAAR